MIGPLAAKVRAIGVLSESLSLTPRRQPRIRCTSQSALGIKNPIQAAEVGRANETHIS